MFQLPSPLPGEINFHESEDRPRTISTHALCFGIGSNYNWLSLNWQECATVVFRAHNLKVSGLSLAAVTKECGIKSRLEFCLYDVVRTIAFKATVLGEFHSQIRQWSEKTFRRTCTFAADLRPMTRAALGRKGLI
jgi:hypothetical protein